MFTPAETAACRRLIEWALDEDLGVRGDLTSQAVLPAELTGRAELVARTAGILAGLPAVVLVCNAIDERIRIEPLKQDGERLQPGEAIAALSGPMRSLLSAERTALNFLQRLSGIATQTGRFVDAVAALPCRILDTRKTTPGWRLLEKYAVRAGGGVNHRFGLFDAVLIKDNHLASLGREPSRVAQAVRAARDKVGDSAPVEVEVDTLEQLDVALLCQPDSVLLDNMSLDQLGEAVRRRNAMAPGVLLEASGGVTLATVRSVAETGVDRISVGALTHSAPALDVGLDYLA
jgi:nicotinate-nucleotide pyrophosphorylase (carboxylating)